MKKVLTIVVGVLFCSSNMIYAQRFSLLNPTPEETAVYRKDAEKIDEAALKKANVQLVFVKNYYEKLSNPQLSELKGIFCQWNVHEEVDKQLGKIPVNNTYLADSTLLQYKKACLYAYSSNLALAGSLTGMAIFYRVKLNLDDEQLAALTDAQLKISSMLSSYSDEQLFDDDTTHTLPHQRFFDHKMRRALQSKDSVGYIAFNDIDHSVALNVLTQSQFEKVVNLGYSKDKVREAERIWNVLDSAQMTSDLDKNLALYHIQTYLKKLRVAEETFWNDYEARKKARHQVKLYAPNVIKRYFSLRPKKNDANKQNNTNNNNYLW